MQDSQSLVGLNNNLANNNTDSVIVSSYYFGSVTSGKCVKSIFCFQISGICHVFCLSGLEICFAEIENDLMTLSIMLKSPHSVEFRQQMEDWAQSLQDLGKVDIQGKKRNVEIFHQVQKYYHHLLLCLSILTGELLYLFERYQQEWAFLTRVFHDNFSFQRMDLVCLCVITSDTYLIFALL